MHVFTELGIRIQDGQLLFDPCLLEDCELLHDDSKIQFVNQQDEFVEIALPAGSFAFTLCQTPVVYHHQATESRIVVSTADQEPEERNDLMLTMDETKNVFARTGAIIRIDVFLQLQNTLLDFVTGLVEQTSGRGTVPVSKSLSR